MNEAVVALNGEFEQPKQLSQSERLQLAWALSWPCMLLGLVCCLLRLQTWIWHAQLQNIDLALCLPQLFLMAPWVVRRTVRMEFPGVHLLVIRRGATEGTPTMKYSESLSVAWLIVWRSTVLSVLFYLSMMVAFAAVGGLGAIERLQQGVLSLSGWIWNSAAELAMFYVWIVPAMLAKRYSGFSLRIERSAL